MQNINSYPPGGGEKAPPPGGRWAIKRQKRGGKAVNSEPDGTTPLSRRPWVTKVKIWMRRRQEKPANAGKDCQATGKGRPKRERFQATYPEHTWYPSERDPAYSITLKPRKMDTRNGVTYLKLSGN